MLVFSLAKRLGSTEEGWWLPVSTLAVSVAILVATLAIVRGFEEAFEERILGLVPHVLVYSEKAERDWPALAREISGGEAVLSATPFVQLPALARAGAQSAAAAMVGTDAQNGKEARIFARHMPASAPAVPARGEVLLGRGLAQKLGAKSGQTVRFWVPRQSRAPQNRERSGAGRYLPLAVAGIFSSGSELDAHLAVMDFGQAREIAGAARGAHGLRLRLSEPFQARKFALAFNLENDRRGLFAEDWSRDYGNLFAAIGLSRLLLFVLLLAVVFVATFNLSANLFICVERNKHKLARLKTLGASLGFLWRLIGLRGAFLAGGGLALGIALGGASVLLLREAFRLLQEAWGIQILQTGVYFINYLPAELALADIGLVALGTLLLSLPAVFLPAWRAMRLRPCDILRWE